MSPSVATWSNRTRRRQFDRGQFRCRLHGGDGAHALLGAAHVGAAAWRFLLHALELLRDLDGGDAQRHPGVETLCYLGLLHSWCGRLDKAHAAVAQARALADRLKHPMSQAVSLHFSAVVHCFTGEPQVAHHLLRRLFRVTKEAGVWRGAGGQTSVYGWSLAMLGDTATGLALVALRQGAAFFAMQAEAAGAR